MASNQFLPPVILVIEVKLGNLVNILKLLKLDNFINRVKIGNMGKGAQKGILCGLFRKHAKLF